MDNEAKKILCCNKLAMLLQNYGDLAPGLPPHALHALNEAADEAISVLEPALLEAAKHWQSPVILGELIEATPGAPAEED